MKKERKEAKLSLKVGDYHTPSAPQTIQLQWRK
jgi:hypothetical protein